MVVDTARISENRGPGYLGASVRYHTNGGRTSAPSVMALVEARIWELPYAAVLMSLVPTMGPVYWPLSTPHGPGHFGWPTRMGGLVTTMTTSSFSTVFGASVQVMHKELMRRLVSLARSVTPDKVHDARTTIRRLLATLSGYKRFFEVAPRRRYIAALKQVAHKLDALRDADVMQTSMIGILNHAGPSPTREREALLALTSRGCIQKRSALEADIASGRWSARLTRLRCAATAALANIQSAKSIPYSVAHIVERKRKRLRSSLDYHGRAPRALHRLRSKVREMRYLLEQALSLGCQGSRFEIARLCKLQDALGALHDAWVLSRTIKKKPGCDHATGEFARGMEQQQKRLFDGYRKTRKALLRLW
jgi:CHAD domain-containing protein